MRRITTSTRAVDLFGAGKDGFKDGDLANGIVPTDFNADWPNQLQEELARVVEGAGLALDGAVLTQVLLAVKRLFGGNVTTVNAANSPFVLTAEHAGLVLMDATGGNISATLPAVNVVTGVPLRFKFSRIDATANTATTNRAGADTFIGGATNFALGGQGSYRIIQGDAGSGWVTTASSSTAQSNIASLTATVAANALTGTLSAETLDFRSTTLTSGVPVSRTAAAAVSLVVPSGATLGTVNAQAARLAWGWLDNAGTLEPFVVNLAGGVNLDETTLISTTAISAASDSADVVYSTVARAGVAFRVRGFCDITEAAAGTWATGPTLVQPVGGQALAALNSIGFGQTWQMVTGGRSLGTTFYNLTGRPIMLAVMGNSSVGNNSMNVSINGGAAFAFGAIGAITGTIAGTVIIPIGASYVVNASSTTLSSWAELR